MASPVKRRRDRLTPTQARAARRDRKTRRKRLQRVLLLSGIGVITFFFIVALFAPSLPISIGAGRGGSAGTSVPDDGAQHIGRGDSHPSYSSVPATSGWHYTDSGAPLPWGVYTEPIPDEVLIHNLEHGGVGIHYSCPDGCDFLVQQLELFAILGEDSWLDKYIETLDPGQHGADLAVASDLLRRYKIIMSPYPDMDTTIALTAWNFIDKFEEFDEPRIIQFILDHVSSDAAPESLAP